MRDLLPVTRQDMIAELERELELRRVVYPSRVLAGRLSQKKADRQFQVLQAVLELIEGRGER